MLVWVGKCNKAIGRFVKRIGLFFAVFLALCGGLVIAFAAYEFLCWITPVDTTKPAAQIDVTRIALTVVAGVGGGVALVIAYRRQRDIEQGRFVERFGAAAAQLGAADVAVRIAGVYAMAGTADESSGLRRQQCIDVLCGCLRLPYDSEQGSSGRTKLVLTTPTDSENTDKGNREEHIEYRQNDREVRLDSAGPQRCWRSAMLGSLSPSANVPFAMASRRAATIEALDHGGFWSGAL
ncbi:hypothetical protein OHB26_00275 [Nocardia sp. NBC_01503]|uniref:hypothetical protein n=1 Tax=Nocardia sp. NBC_01503 TaxID=2975997 RepID=UPI002E7BAD4E|nr:hypothetical protein [Nocardia sp. NBC_01503]WTL32751.1 hypothetical protein OHB26_00275 [Nocardia sp. NBC_01503]